MFLRWHEDEEIQRKIDTYGSGGTNLLDPKCGTHYYLKWFNKKKDEYEKETELDEIQIEEEEKELKEKRMFYYNPMIADIISKRKEKYGRA